MFRGFPTFAVTDETGSCPKAGRPTSGLAHPDWPRTPRGRRRAHDHSHPAPTASPKTRAPWGGTAVNTPRCPMAPLGLPTKATAPQPRRDPPPRCTPRVNAGAGRSGSRQGLGGAASTPRRSSSPVYPQGNPQDTLPVNLWSRCEARSGVLGPGRWAALAPTPRPRAFYAYAASCRSQQRCSGGRGQS